MGIRPVSRHYHKAKNWHRHMHNEGFNRTSAWISDPNTLVQPRETPAGTPVAGSAGYERLPSHTGKLSPLHRHIRVEERSSRRFFFNLSSGRGR
jgi:hypothetical protein